MRTILTLAIATLLAVACLAAASEPRLNSAVVYVVRHAEKAADGGRDPNLSDAGKSRAARLAEILADEDLAAVYVTPTIRSRDTGAPAARAADIELTPYNPFDNDALVKQIHDEHPARAALIVAHSNTVAPIVHALGGPKESDLAEDEYSRLYAVVIEDGRAVRTLRLRF